ncbi:hypothetical protein [Vitreimonas sp.]|uniref:hypothetical protein n=1 Tax=Vitreimonas sp. TaxID=3069702 RepID=UPI002ED9F27B
MPEVIDHRPPEGVVEWGPLIRQAGQNFVPLGGRVETSPLSELLGRVGAVVTAADCNRLLVTLNEFVREQIARVEANSATPIEAWTLPSSVLSHLARRQLWNGAAVSNAKGVLAHTLSSGLNTHFNRVRALAAHDATVVTSCWHDVSAPIAPLVAAYASIDRVVRPEWLHWNLGTLGSWPTFLLDALETAERHVLFVAGLWVYLRLGWIAPTDIVARYERWHAFLSNGQDDRTGHGTAMRSLSLAADFAALPIANEYAHDVAKCTAALRFSREQLFLRREEREVEEAGRYNTALLDQAAGQAKTWLTEWCDLRGTDYPPEQLTFDVSRSMLKIIGTHSGWAGPRALPRGN